MLQPRGKGLMATLLRYRNEVRDADTYFDDIPNVKVTKDMLQLADHILDSKAAHFDPDKFEDRYEQALTDLIKAKRAGKAPPTLSTPRPSNVINLMDALRRSVKAERGGETRKSSRGKAPRASKKRAAPKKARLKRAS
jgi:DNA end-binding protein Ku